MELSGKLIAVAVIAVVLAIVGISVRDTQLCQPLVDAIQNEDFAEVNRLIKEEHHHPDCVDKHGWTPLCHVAKLGKDKFMNPLLNEESDLSRPLFVAAEFGRTNMLSKLISHGADPNMTHMGQTPLHIAVRNKQFRTVVALLKAQSDPNAKYNSRTPLHYAVEMNDLTFVNVLLKHNADPNALDEEGRSSLHLALQVDARWRVALLLINEPETDIEKKYMNKTPMELIMEKGDKRLANAITSALKEKSSKGGGISNKGSLK